jgi:polysaccharide chain length determinant protein (PEP-CTERM system associated)
MFGARDFTVHDYLAMLRRRLWIIVIPALITPVAVYLYSRTIPDRYTSQTLVLVEQPQVPDRLIMTLGGDELNHRLSTMQEQILSRTRLQPLIERFDLYREDRDRVPMEDLVQRLRQSITITVVRAESRSRTGGIPGFYVSFTAASPRLAQQVCSEITSMFMSENLRLREQRAQGTTEFLSSQLDEAKRRLDEHDRKLADFKRRNIGRLPGQEQANLNMLTSLTGQLDSVTQGLARAQQDKTYMESLLAQQISALRSLQGAGSPQTIDSQLEAARARLVALEARYTADHPDVMKTRGEIAQLEAMRRDAASQPQAKEETAGGLEPKEIQQLRAQIHLINSAISERQAQQKRLQQEIGNYQARVQLSPMVEEEYKLLTRDYQIALDFYNSLLGKKTESEMATDLERRQQGEQFRIMDPANLPEAPSYPNRLQFAGGGLAGGIGLGVLIALLLEFRNPAIRTEQDVEFYLQIPTLAMMPVVMDGNGDQKKRWLQRFRGDGRKRSAALKRQKKREKELVTK